MATIFSKIINGEIPSYEVASDERFFAFLDINPLAMGHTLVVPRVETDYIFDLEPELLGQMMVFAQRVAKRIKQATGCKRVAVVVLGMDVPHAHIHLIPMNSMTDVDFSKEKLKPTVEEFLAIKNKIK